MPNSIDYDASAGRLVVGGGFVEPVPVQVWNYSVGGKQVLTQWFNGRKRVRERPMIGDRRKPPPLGDIQPDRWFEYTTELLNVHNVLGLIVALEPTQAAPLQRICAGPLIDEATLRAAGAFRRLGCRRRNKSDPHGVDNDGFLVPSMLIQEQAVEIRVIA